MIYPHYCSVSGSMSKGSCDVGSGMWRLAVGTVLRPAGTKSEWCMVLSMGSQVVVLVVQCGAE